MTKKKDDIAAKYAEAKFILKNTGKLQNERLNESARMCARHALWLSEKLIRQQRTLSTKELTDLSRECRGWHAQARSYDEGASSGLIADMQKRLGDLEGAANDNSLDELDDELDEPDLKVAK